MDLNTLCVLAMFAGLIALLFTGFPIAFVLGGIGALFALLGSVLNANGLAVDADLRYLAFTVNRAYGALSSNNLLPVPLFVFMGYVLDRSGIAEDLLRVLEILLRRVPGGLAIGVTLIGIVLAATTGIIGASVVLLTALALPTMLKQGYKIELAVGTVCAVGCLGILIPPSVMLVLMADQMTLPVGDLFLGAVLPGLLLGLIYMIYVFVLALVNPALAPPAKDRLPIRAGEVLGLLAKALLAPVALIGSVLGSMFAGIASPSEAAGVGAAAALLLAALRRRLTYAMLRDVTYATARTCSFIFAVLLGAICYAVVLRGFGGDQVIEGALAGLKLGKYGTLAVVLFAIFVLGFFMDWVEITLVVLPLAAPALAKMGVDMVWFAILVAVCLQNSFLTPPVGFALFYCKSAAPPEVTMAHIYRGIVPFVILQLLGLAICVAIPELATWLPKLAR